MGESERSQHAVTDSVLTLSGQYPPEHLHTAATEHLEHLAHLDTPELDAALAAIIATLHERRPRWMAHAACRHTSGLDWHQATDRPTKRTAPAIEAMRTVCTACPVLKACTDWVHATPSTDRLPGVVAGLTVAERRHLRRTTTTPTPLKD